MLGVNHGLHVPVIARNIEPIGDRNAVIDFHLPSEGAVLRLRPVLMTMLVATLGLLPAALSHGIGSDSQRPFAIVIVGGLISDLLVSIFLLPTLYAWFASPDDRLPQPVSEGDV